MSTAHQNFLERMAAKAAKKEAVRHGNAPIQKEEFLRMRIQVFEPLLRIVLLLVAVLIGCLAFWLHHEVENAVLTVFVAGIAATFGWFAIIGRRESVQAALADTAEFIYRRFVD